MEKYKNPVNKPDLPNVSNETIKQIIDIQMKYCLFELNLEYQIIKKAKCIINKKIEILQ